MITTYWSDCCTAHPTAGPPGAAMPCAPHKDLAAARETDPFCSHGASVPWELLVVSCTGWLCVACLMAQHQGHMDHPRPRAGMWPNRRLMASGLYKRSCRCAYLAAGHVGLSDKHIVRRSETVIARFATCRARSAATAVPLQACSHLSLLDPATLHL